MTIVVGCGTFLLKMPRFGRNDYDNAGVGSNSMQLPSGGFSEYDCLFVELSDGRKVSERSSLKSMLTSFVRV